MNSFNTEYTTILTRNNKSPLKNISSLPAILQPFFPIQRVVVSCRSTNLQYPLFRKINDKEKHQSV